MDLRTRQVELPTGVTVPWVERGGPGGPHLLLLHAVGDSWRSFEQVLPYLPASVHTVVPSQRGHGDATRPATGYATADFAADVVAFLDALEIPAAVVAGGSSGGLVARRLALEHPDRVLGLALLGSPHRLGGKPALESLWTDSISRLTDPMPDGFAEDVVDACLSSPIPDDVRATLVRECGKVPAHVWVETFRGLLDDDTAERLDAITCPTRVFWGDADAFLPRDDQDRLTASIPGAELVVREGVGHVLYWEDPRRTAEDLLAFVADVSGPRPE